ncbi:MAG: hypothetical protein K2I89_08745 [Muribaculaceae bacterium]|nr:hypothetical protein [Muribaculaceae bacterium]MDE5595643.1 hypothetical protein [Muribaculaceae bacterium]
MNKLILVIIILLSSAFTISASDSVMESPTCDNNSPQVCQFSLSSYAGTVDNNGNTSYFTVGLSCPQKEDTYATVVVFVNGEHAASTVVKVPAEKTSSQSVNIKVGQDYKGKAYKLVVQ